MSRLKLWLVRHGETEVNVGIWTAEPEKTHLTLTGRGQAENSAAQVLEQPDLFISSPLVRAEETMEFFRARWPDTPLITLPIQEFIYLSPRRLALLSQAERKEQIKDYWLRNDPHYCDGEGAESFATFLKRVSAFHQQITQHHGYVVVVGHGQFFKAFQIGLHQGFASNSSWMHVFREKETQEPIKNGSIFELYFN